MAVITVSRQSGINAEELLSACAKKHMMTIFSQELLNEVAKESHRSIQDIKQLYDMDSFSSLKVFLAEMIQSFGTTGMYPLPGAGLDTTLVTPYVASDNKREENKTYITVLNNIIKAVAKKDNVFIIGRGAQCVCAGMPGCFHIRLVGDRTTSIERIQRSAACTATEAEHIFKKTEKNRAEYIEYFFNADINDPSLYHVVINIDKCGPLYLERFISALLK